MPTLQIREMPQSIYEDLVLSAEKSRRSLTQEAIVLIEKGLEMNENKLSKIDLMEKIRTMPKSTLSTKQQIVDAIRSDRNR